MAPSQIPLSSGLDDNDDDDDGDDDAYDYNDENDKDDNDDVDDNDEDHDGSISDNRVFGPHQPTPVRYSVNI